MRTRCTQSTTSEHSGTNRRTRSLCAWAGASTDVVRVYSVAVVQLLDHLDAMLRHGLKERYRLFDTHSEPPSFWPFVSKLTFAQNVDYIQSIANSRPGLDRGRAWLALAVNESSLQGYFQQMATEHKLATCVRSRTHPVAPLVRRS